MLDAVTDQRRQEGVPPAALRVRPKEAAVERALSPRLAPGLTASAGVMIAVGGLGTWIRATTVPTGTATLEQVAVVTGRSGTGGWVLLGIGVACVIAAFAWRSRVAQARAVAAVTAVVAIVFSAVRLGLIDSRAARMAEEARSTSGIDVYHAGFGWGAWLLLAGVVLLALALLVAGLREIDLRRGS